MSHEILVEAFSGLEPDWLRSLWRELHAGAPVFYGKGAGGDWMTEGGVP